MPLPETAHGWEQEADRIAIDLLDSGAIGSCDAVRGLLKEAARRGMHFVINTQYNDALQRRAEVTQAIAIAHDSPGC